MESAENLSATFSPDGRWVSYATTAVRGGLTSLCARHRRYRHQSRPDNPGRSFDEAGRARHTAGMTTTEKIAVSLPRQIAARLRRAVKQGRATSVSAYVASALDEKAKLDDLSALLDEMLAASGAR